MHMLIRSVRSALVGFALLAPAAQAAALDVFVCEPEWGALVRALAPGAKVTSATHARQDPHYIEARPSLIASLRQADLAVCTGASLEAGWLPMLQRRAANARVRDGREGMFYAADAVQLIHAHEHADRRMGDVHAEGNPHFHLDPYRMLRVAEALAGRLATIDPSRAEEYQQRYQHWGGRWRKHIARWETQAAPLAGRSVAAQHSSFAYLWAWLGITQIADLEPKPGLPPTVAHLRQVLDKVREAPPMAVVQTLYQDPQAGEWLVEQIAAPLLILPSTVTREGPSSDLVGLFDELIDRLNQANRLADG